MDDSQKVKSKVDLVELISEYLPLKKAGRNLKAPCPFHAETSPSFMVSPDLQIWRCFGCGKGGDVFTFLEEKEGMTFPEALEYLAKKIGVTLSKKLSGVTDKKAVLFQINEMASKFFHYLLTSHKVGKEALSYLTERKITPLMIEKFQLGYAPKSWETLLKFLKKKFEISDISQVGLLVGKKNGGFYDRFRGRIMFPLRSPGGEIVGFSGRVIRDNRDEPKYINTPETTIFSKGRLLYGLDLARSAVKTQNNAILVEGEFDAIASFQAGVENVVATKGTALTENQVVQLSRICDNISICFDADLAGDAAARRGIEMADQAGLNIKVIQVKGAKDPADLVLKDPRLWKEAVDKAIPVFDYLISSAFGRHDRSIAQGKKQIAEELLPVFAKISDEVVKAHYISKLASNLEVGEQVLERAMDKNKERSPISAIKFFDQGEVRKGILGTSKSVKLEEYLLALLFQGGQFSLPEDILLNVSDFQNLNLKNLFKMSIIPPGKDDKKQKAFGALSEEEVEAYKRLCLADLSGVSEDLEIWQKEVAKISVAIKKESLKERLKTLSREISEAEKGNKDKDLTILKKRFRDLAENLANF